MLVSQTLFDAGARKAAVANYKAQYEAQVAAYRQTVLTAFQQTGDTLSSERYLADQYRQQQEAAAAALENRKLSETLYQNGINSYLDVSTAETALLERQQNAVTVHIQQMTVNLQLIEAIGGGWTASELPTEKAVAKR